MGILQHAGGRSAQRRVRLNISNKLLEKMHPADLADIVENLGHEDRVSIFNSVTAETAAELLSEVDSGIQTSIIESLGTDKAAAILEEMQPSEAADVLNELGEEQSEQILEEMAASGQRGSGRTPRVSRRHRRRTDGPRLYRVA